MAHYIMCSYWSSKKSAITNRLIRHKTLLTHLQDGLRLADTLGPTKEPEPSWETRVVGEVPESRQLSLKAMQTHRQRHWKDLHEVLLYWWLHSSCPARKLMMLHFLNSLQRPTKSLLSPLFYHDANEIGLSFGVGHAPYTPHNSTFH